MDVKFYSNRISLKGEKFEDFVQKQLHKTASSNKVMKIAAVEDEADSSGQPEVEAKIVNKPKNEEKTTKVKGKESCDEAESSGQLAVEPKHQKGESEKAGDLPNKAKKAATVSKSLVKIAKLDEKTRSFLKEYWLNLYPAEYVEAMLTEQ